MNSQYDEVPDKCKKISRAVCDGVRRYEAQLSGQPYQSLVDLAMLSSLEVRLHKEFADVGHEWAAHGGLNQFLDAQYCGPTTLADAMIVIERLLHSDTDEAYAEALMEAQDMLDEYAEGV